ncbi:hypothetical protein [Halobellus ordinarius]|nr:hypothetical protein [Halobellus sp. ZY16]
MNLPAQLDHPAWTTSIATLLSYGLGLLGMFVLLFVLPFLLFLAL